MNQQTLNNIPPFLAELSKMASCSDIGANPEVVAFVGLKTRKSIDVIEKLLAERNEFQRQLLLISGIVGDGELCDVDTQTCDFIQGMFGKLEGLADQIHYPECWDTMAYPTIFDAIKNLSCNAEVCTQVA